MENINEILTRELTACRLDMWSQQQSFFKKVDAIPLWQKGLFLTALCMLVCSSAMAQTETITRLTQVKVWVNSIVNIIFIIAILYASIMCVLKFVRQEQGAWGYAFGVLIAFILWGGFTTYKNDIFNLMGGSNLMVVE